MLKVAVAPDSFKGTLTSAQAANCIARGLNNVLTGIRITKIPMADGGEGTVAAVITATGGKLLHRTVCGPRGKPVRAAFGVTGDGTAAVIEMAAASGLALLPPRQRNPLLTTSYGTGELIRHALGLPVNTLIIGLGGSATCDGGSGMARALGARLLDAHGRELPGGGGALTGLRTIDISSLDPRLKTVAVSGACDVTNPLAGTRGAAYVYAPQKGATPAMVRKLDAGLQQLAKVMASDLGTAVAKVRGAGAAGGLGAALVAFAGGTLRSGYALVSETVRLRDQLQDCDLVITGEGRLDQQTLNGKVPAGVARVAKQLGLPVIALGGSLGDGAERLYAAGIDAFFSASPGWAVPAKLRALAPVRLTTCAEELGCLLAINTIGGVRLRKPFQSLEPAL